MLCTRCHECHICEGPSTGNATGASGPGDWCWPEAEPKAKTPTASCRPQPGPHTSSLVQLRCCQTLHRPSETLENLGVNCFADLGTHHRKSCSSGFSVFYNGFIPTTTVLTTTWSLEVILIPSFPKRKSGWFVEFLCPCWGTTPRSQGASGPVSDGREAAGGAAPLQVLGASQTLPDPQLSSPPLFPPLSWVSLQLHEPVCPKGRP